MSDLDKDIIEEYAKHKSSYRVARKLGVNIDYVIQVLDDVEINKEPDTSKCTWDGYGDPEKEKWLVARNPATDSWDNTLPEIIDARQKVEAGTHIMATGRDGPYLLMYLFPRMVKQPQPDYFKPTIEA